VTQLGQLRDAYADFQARDAEILAISTDDAATCQSLDAEEGIPFPLLSDPGKNIINQYTGVKPAGVGANAANVTTFVVDQNGRIVYACTGRPTTEEVLAELDKLQD